MNQMIFDIEKNNYETVLVMKRNKTQDPKIWKQQNLLLRLDTESEKNL